jgi:hypothetical protein
MHKPKTEIKMKKTTIVTSALLCLGLNACLFAGDETEKSSNSNDKEVEKSLTASDNETEKTLIASETSKAKELQNNANYTKTLSDSEILADLKLMAGNQGSFENDNDLTGGFGRLKKFGKQSALTLQANSDACMNMSEENKEEEVGTKGSGTYSYTSMQVTNANGNGDVMVCEGDRAFSFRTITLAESELAGESTSMESNILASASMGSNENMTIDMDGYMAMKMTNTEFDINSYMTLSSSMTANESGISGVVSLSGDFYILQDTYRCNFEMKIDLSETLNQPSESVEATQDCTLTHNGEAVGSLQGDKILDINGDEVK